MFPLPANTGINSTHNTLERQRKETVVMLNVVYSLNLLKHTEYTAEYSTGTGPSVSVSQK